LGTKQRAEIDSLSETVSGQTAAVNELGEQVDRVTLSAWFAFVWFCVAFSLSALILNRFADGMDFRPVMVAK